MSAYCARLLEEKRRCPADDILSVIANAELPDARRAGRAAHRPRAADVLPPPGGGRAARPPATPSPRACWRSWTGPDEWEALRRGPVALPGAVEEMLRWASSTVYNRRTATEDGRATRAGDPSRATRSCCGGRRPTSTSGPSPTLTVRHPPEPESPPGLRGREPLLPRRQPGPPRDLPGLRRAARPGGGDRGGRTGRADAVEQARGLPSCAGAPAQGGGLSAAHHHRGGRRWPCRGSASGRARSLPPRRGRLAVRPCLRLVALGAASILSGSVAGVPDAGATTLPTTVEAWIYPGSPGQPTCDVPAELSGLDSDPVAVLKPQYLTVSAAGRSGSTRRPSCRATASAAADLAAVRAAAHQVYVTVSAGTGATKSLLAGSLEGVGGPGRHRVVRLVQRDRRCRSRLRAEPVDHRDVGAYMALRRRPGGSAAPRAEGVEVDLDAFTTTPWDAERYADVAAAGAHLVVMAYDDEYAVACSPITPYAWLQQVVALRPEPGAGSRSHHRSALLRLHDDDLHQDRARHVERRLRDDGGRARLPDDPGGGGEPAGPRVRVRSGGSPAGSSTTMSMPRRSTPSSRSWRTWG